MLDVVTVNWNAGSQLADLIVSIAQHHQGRVSMVVVVDNASTDGSIAHLEQTVGQLPFDLKIIRNSANLGFGAACNQGAKICLSPYLLFLNPDARLLPEALEKPLDFLQDLRNTDVGICGIQLVDEEGAVSKSCARFPSVAGFFVHAVGLDRYIPSAGNRMAEWDHAQTRDVDQVIGAFFLVRRSLFQSLRGFDERYFVYFEEVDFSRRAHVQGWRSVYLADAQAFHAGGGTSHQVKARRLYYSLRSRLLYSIKHFSLPGAAIVFLVTLSLEPLSRSGLAIARRSWSSLRETWAAYGLLLRWLPQWAFKGVTS